MMWFELPIFDIDDTLASWLEAYLASCSTQAEFSPALEASAAAGVRDAAETNWLLQQANIW